MTAVDIATIPYADFVAILGQENTPPGGARTVALWNRWAVELGAAGGGVVQVLDLACSTGYSGRAFADGALTCRVTGIDLSRPALAVAGAKAGADVGFRYRHADAADLPLADESVDVILGGCNFAFIGQRERARAEAVRVLRPGGLLMTASFFYRRSVSPRVVDDVAHAIGFRPSTTWNLPFWRDFFGGDFTLQRADVAELHAERRWPILGYAVGIALVADAYPLSLRQRAAAARRMYRTRTILNRHRDFQGVAVEAWRKP